MKKQLEEKIAKGRADLKKIREQAGPDYDFSKVTVFNGTDEEKCAAMRKLNDDVEKDCKALDGIRAVEAAEERREREEKDAVNMNRPRFSTEEPAKKERKSLSQAIFESGALKEHRNRGEVSLKGVEVKTLMERTAGYAPESLRSGNVTPYALRPIQFLDILPIIPTSQAVYKFMEETTHDASLAVEKAEGAAAGEVQYVYTERSATIEKLPGYLPVTDEQLDDVPGLQAIIEANLMEDVRRRADYQGLNGTGVTPLMLGVLNKPSILGTTPEADDGIADTILRGIKDVSVTGRAVASAIVLNPTDWLTERLRKTKDGAYIWGSPANMGPLGMWGLPVAQADSLAQGTGLVGDFRQHAALVVREDISVEVGMINDDFIKGRKAIKATMRGAFVWRRAAAFNAVELPAA